MCFFFCRAFVAPVDIQAFTSETKSKLSAKSQVVKTRYFVQAVKEICVAFDELHKEKSSHLRDETDKSTPGFEASSADGVEDGGAEADLKNGKSSVAPGGETTSVVKSENNSEHIKPLISGHADDSSSRHMSFEGNDKISNGEQAKKEVFSPASLDEPSIKEEFSDDKIATSNCTKKTLRDDQMSKKMAPASKKRTEQGQKSSSSAATILRDDKSSGCLDLLDSEEQLKDRVKGKESGGSVRKFSSDTLKSDSNYTGGKKTKELLKSKSNLKATDDVLDAAANPKGEITGKKKRGEPGLGKPNFRADEVLHPAKKSKVLDMKNDASKGSIVNKTKGNSPSSNNVNSKAAKQSESKISISHVLALRAPVSIISDVSGDEAVLPVSKRHRRVMEAMFDSASSNSDNKIGKNPVELKNYNSSSSHVKILGTQLSRRRRAVCLFDDDDEEDPKTPLHGGSIQDVKVTSVVSDVSKSSDVNHSSAANAQHSVEESNQHDNNGPKEASSKLMNDFVSPTRPQTVERRPTHASITPERSESEQLSSQETKPDLISLRKSPHLVSATKQVEQHRNTKAAAKVSGNGTQKKAPSVSVKGLGVTSEGLKSSQQNQVLSQRNRQASSVERLKSTPKAISQGNDTTFVTETSIEYGSALLLLFFITFS